jgi:hypothetical protein
MTARDAWRAAHRRQRIERRTGAELYRLACDCMGVEPDPENAFRDPFICQRIFTALERLNQMPDRRESDRYARTRTVLNSFGRLNPWGRAAVCYRDCQRVRSLRQRLLEIAPEPGGYVTGLLSEAPRKMWWHDYGSPVAPLSRDDVALYESAPC